jgi:ubiquinone/menaquinone biosynthesis C-methylase UbiE
MTNDYLSRFSSRAPFYHQNRPRYPGAVIDLLARKIGLTPDSVIADIGAGTGISSELFLNNGNTVYAVEPNSEMRELAQQFYGENPRFILSEGQAEATGLPDASMDIVVAGQAFHWFDPAAARKEFRRILKPGGYAVLFWNTRQNDQAPVMADYNAMLKELDVEKEGTPRAAKVISEEAAIAEFYSGHFEKRELPNIQMMDFDKLVGRTTSASYMPLPDEPGYDLVMTRLKEMFERHQQEGQVAFPYTTEVYFGNFTDARSARIMKYRCEG